MPSQNEVKLESGLGGNPSLPQSFIDEGFEGDLGALPAFHGRWLESISGGLGKIDANITPLGYGLYLLSGLAAPEAHTAAPDDISFEALKSANKTLAMRILQAQCACQNAAPISFVQAAELLDDLGRAHDAESLLILALHRCGEEMEPLFMVAKTMNDLGIFERALSAYQRIIKLDRHNSLARILGAKCLVRLKRGHEVDLFLGQGRFLDLKAEMLEDLGYLAADLGFANKASRILEFNWATRPDPNILHARLKLLARKGQGKARWHEVQSALNAGIEPLAVDRMHAAAIASRMGDKTAEKSLLGFEHSGVLGMSAPTALPLTPKVALCISGQMRGYEACADSVIEHVINKYNADVFISTWDNQGSSTPAWRHFMRLLPRAVAAAISKRHGKEQFAKSFPMLTDLIEGKTSAKITKQSLRAAYGEATCQIVNEAAFEAEHFTPSFIEYSGNKALLKNQMKMCYQIDQANQLKTNAEKQMGARYDIVLRMRPDLKITGSPIPDTDFFGFDVYCEFVHGKGCGDQVCSSSSENMDLLASVWQRSLRLAHGGRNPKIDGDRRGIGGHGFFSETLWINGLAPRAFAKPAGTQLINTPLDIAKASLAMLQDMQAWPRLDEQDKLCVKEILNELKAPEYQRAVQKKCAALAANLG